MAKSIPALVKPALLIWARESACLSQEEAAHGLGVTVEKLQGWEAGKANPTVSQLRRMAEKYKRPLSVFYLPDPPKGFQPLRDFRRLAGTVAHQYSPQLAYEVRAAFERRTVALDVLETLGEQPAQLNISARRNEDPEQIGRRLRERLGITLQQQSRWGEPDNAFRAWRDALEAAGVLVFVLSGAHHQVALDEMRGFAIAEQPLPVIVVNGKDRSAGRIFTLIHELAHIVIGQSIIENTVEAGDDLPAPDRQIERFCNQVAAATLMPAEALLQEILVSSKIPLRAEWSDEDIVTLARRYGVSREALLVRLVELQQISNNFYQSKRKLYARQRDEAEEPEGGGFAPYHYQVLGHLGRGFARLILQGYYDNRLTLSTVSGYLGVQAKYVPTIENAAFGVPA